MAGGDLRLALEFYVWNMQLSEALYGPLQNFEVSLRNAVDTELSNHFGIDWLSNISWQAREQERLTDAREELRNLRLRGNPPDVIAALRFGFWVGIFDRHYENDLWRPHLRNIFQNAPDPLRRKNVFGIVDSVRKLRNRIAHHEPILHRKLEDEYQQLIEFIGWLDIDLAKWVHAHSRFQAVFESRPNK